MNYKTELYKNALKAIEKIYTESMYDPNVDLFRSFDIINSLNDNQIASKEHLTKAIIPILKDMSEGSQGVGILDQSPGTHII